MKGIPSAVVARAAIEQSAVGALHLLRQRDSSTHLSRLVHAATELIFLLFSKFLVVIF